VIRAALCVAGALAGGCSRSEYAPTCAPEPGPHHQVACVGVCINEIGAENDTYVTDPEDLFALDPSEATEDWIELYNQNDRTESLDGYTIERWDNGFAKTRLDGLSIPPGGCLLLVGISKEVEAGELRFSFDLSAEWGTLRLRKDYQGDACMHDRVYYPSQRDQDPPSSWGRARGGVPRDGGPVFQSQVPPTPGATVSGQECGRAPSLDPETGDTGTVTGATDTVTGDTGTATGGTGAGTP
jgi:hypothetical protein